MSNKFADFFRAFVTDIRQRVVEEAWFGKVVTSNFDPADLGRPTSHTVTETAFPHRVSLTETNRQSAAANNRSFAEMLGWSFHKEPSPERDGPGPDMDR